MTPVSLPITPSVPSAGTYSTADLNLFPPSLSNPKPLTRASYLAQWGVQAPAYDESNPTRNWFDTSATPGPYFQVVIAGGVASVESLPVPANVSVPNLPGAFEYPAWGNSPNTPATQNGEPLSGLLLCSQQDASAVAVAIPGSVVGLDPLQATIVPNGETREMFVINIGGQSFLAASLRQDMTAQNLSGNQYVSGGVGSPGSFVMNSQGTPVWTPTPDPGLSAGPALPLPCRQLVAGESLILNPAMGMNPNSTSSWLVSNSTNAALAPSGSGSVTLTAQQAAQLAFCAAVLGALNTREMFGVPPLTS